MRRIDFVRIFLVSILTLALSGVSVADSGSSEMRDYFQLVESVEGEIYKITGELEASESNLENEIDSEQFDLERTSASFHRAQAKIRVQLDRLSQSPIPNVASVHKQSVLSMNEKIISMMDLTLKMLRLTDEMIALGERAEREQNLSDSLSSEMAKKMNEIETLNLQLETLADEVDALDNQAEAERDRLSQKFGL